MSATGQFAASAIAASQVSPPPSPTRRVRSLLPGVLGVPDVLFDISADSWWLACLFGNFLLCTNIWLTFQGLFRGLGENDSSKWNLRLLLLGTPGCGRPGGTRKLVLNLGFF